MGGVTLISGPPRSGTTERVLERVSARYGEDPFAETLVLVPTVRHADRFRRRLVASTRVALGLRVETLAMFARGVVQPGTGSSERVARELLSRVIAEQVEAGGGSAVGRQNLMRPTDTHDASLLAPAC